MEELILTKEKGLRLKISKDRKSQVLAAIKTYIKRQNEYRSRHGVNEPLEFIQLCTHCYEIYTKKQAEWKWYSGDSFNSICEGCHELPQVTNWENDPENGWVVEISIKTKEIVKRTATCPNCLGSGHHYSRSYRGSEMNSCSFCHGSGRVPERLKDSVKLTNSNSYRYYNNMMDI